MVNRCASHAVAGSAVLAASLLQPFRPFTITKTAGACSLALPCSVHDDAQPPFPLLLLIRLKLQRGGIRRPAAAAARSATGGVGRKGAREAQVWCGELLEGRRSEHHAAGGWHGGEGRRV